RGGRALAALVDSLRLRHDELRVLLGDGRGESGLRRHAIRRHERTQMTARFAKTTVNAAVGWVLLAFSAGAQGGISVRADNPLQIARPSETIGISWSSVRAQLPGAQP